MLKEILELVQELKEFISDEKYNDLIKYIKSETPDDVIKTIVGKLTTELDLLISRFDAISDFGRKNIAMADISDIEQQISHMEIPVDLFEIFRGEKLLNIFSRINDVALLSA